jgi:Enterocin A Immunity.
LILKDKEVTGNLRDYLLEADNQLTGVDSLLDQVTNKLRIELKPYADKGHLPKSLTKFYANDLMEPKSLLSILLARN